MSCDRVLEVAHEQGAKIPLTSLQPSHPFLDHLQYCLISLHFCFLEDHSSSRNIEVLTLTGCSVIALISECSYCLSSGL